MKEAKAKEGKCVNGNEERGEKVNEEKC